MANQSKGDDGGGRVFVNTYRPMVVTRYGIDACATHDIPPMVDGSIRREPDLEHRWPSISCLCRKGKFAPRLRVGDRVVYLTTKGRYGDDERRPHWRLAAVLRVVALFDTHAMAAAWYEGRGLGLPNNCVVPGNRALPLTHTHMRGRLRKAAAAGCGPSGCAPRVRRGCGSGGGCGDGDVHGEWDRIYRKRAKAHGRFVVCEAEFRELSWDAPVVHAADLKYAFGGLPGTRNPGALPMAGLIRLRRRLGLGAAAVAR